LPSFNSADKEVEVVNKVRSLGQMIRNDLCDDGDILSVLRIECTNKHTGAQTSYVTDDVKIALFRQSS